MAEESTDDVFHHLTYLSGQIFADLLSKRIPVRGAIVYGDFNVERDDTKDHELFWGNALIDAYRVEKKEKWIGIVVCPTALRNSTQKSTIVKNEINGLWIQRKKDKYLLINPFFHITNYIQEMAEGLLKRKNSEMLIKEAIGKEIMALRFINYKAEYYRKVYGRLTKTNKNIAIKYYNTQEFLKKVLGETRYAYALGEKHYKPFTNQKRDTIYLPSYLPKFYNG